MNATFPRTTMRHKLLSVFKCTVAQVELSKGRLVGVATGVTTYASREVSSNRKIPCGHSKWDRFAFKP